MCISRAKRSVSFPFPSSPHWVPTTTVAGTRYLRSLCRITHNCSAPGRVAGKERGGAGRKAFSPLLGPRRDAVIIRRRRRRPGSAADEQGPPPLVWAGDHTENAPLLPGRNG